MTCVCECFQVCERAGLHKNKWQLTHVNYMAVVGDRGIHLLDIQ